MPRRRADAGRLTNEDVTPALAALYRGDEAEGKRLLPPEANVFEAAVPEEIGEFVVHRVSFGQAEGCYSQERYGNPAYRPANESPAQAGLSIQRRFGAA